MGRSGHGGDGHACPGFHPALGCRRVPAGAGLGSGGACPDDHGGEPGCDGPEPGDGGGPAPHRVTLAGSPVRAPVRSSRRGGHASCPRRGGDAVGGGAFSNKMERVLGATTVAVARSGASTLAEFAAAGVPSVLVPLPASVDDHQRFNARAMERAGGARVLEQADMVPGLVLGALAGFLDDEPARVRCARAAMALHRPDAARRMAERLVSLARTRGAARGGRDVTAARVVPGATGVVP